MRNELVGHQAQRPLRLPRAQAGGATIPGMDRRLSVEPVLRRFPSSQEAQLRAALEESDRHAVFYPLLDPREVLLGPDAVTAGGYRYTSWALFQLCHSVSPGLYRFLMELSGAHRADGDSPGDFSLSEAVDTLNRMIRRRFASRLAGKQLLRDGKSRLVEGLVGSKYRRLANLELYSRARAASDDTLFYEGSLAGRWCLLRLYRPRVFFTLDPDDSFYAGFHFSNNEVGKGAVRSAPFVVRAAGRTCALAGFVSGAGLRHLGDTFAARLSRMFNGTFGRRADPAEYLRNADRLRGVGLGLGLDDPDAEESRRQDLVHFLTRHGVRIALATRVVGSMLAQGSYETERTPLPQIERSVLATRDAFDLFNAIGREAKRMPIGVREQAEQVAHSLLLGKINVPRPTR